jgi:hypothetical protein
MGRAWVKRAVVGTALMLTILAMLRRDHGRAGAAPKPGRCYFG